MHAKITWFTLVHVISVMLCRHDQAELLSSCELNCLWLILCNNCSV